MTLKLAVVFNFIFVLSTLAILAFSQSVQIGYPPPDKRIHRGRNLTVQIVQPNSIEGSFTIGIAIGLASCKDIPGCVYPYMGEVLYHGPFTPKRHRRSQPYQDFTVMIPAQMTKGKASLNVAYAALWGAGNVPAFDTLNETLYVV